MSDQPTYALLLDWMTESLALAPTTEPVAPGIVWRNLGVVTLSVGIPPAFTLHPASTTVNEGSAATFTATATNASSYQWQKQESGAGAWADISGATSASYTTGTLTIAADNTDKYRVVATGPGGTTTSNSATLTVFSPAALTSLWGWWQHDYAGSLFTERTSPATATTDGNPVGTWRSRNSPAIDIPAMTNDTKRPVWNASRGVQFFVRTDGGTTNAGMLKTGLSAFNRANFGGGIILDVHGNGYTGHISFGAGASAFDLNCGSNADPRNVARYFDGSTFTSTGKYFSSRRCVITWQNSGSSTKVWVNGDLYTGTALGSLGLTSITLGQFYGGIPSATTIKEIVVCSATPSDSEMAALNTYLRNRAGTLGNGNLVVTLGDSLTVGSGSESGQAWHYRVTNRPLSEWRSYAYEGAFLYSGTPQTAANLVTSGAGFTEKICVMWIGTNDMYSGARTGAQLWSDYNTYRSTIMASGWKTVGCTLQAMGTNDAAAQAFNTLLLANSASFSAVADLRSTLSNSSNTTYYTSDAVHLKDAGYVVAANLIQTAMESIT